MKKFTKGCLMTALVLFLVGIVLCGVCGLLGGFRELEEMESIKGIPFVWRMDSDGDWRIGFFRSPGYDRDDWEELEELEEIEDIESVEEVRKVVDQTMEKKRKELEGKKEQLPLTAETLGSLEIDVDECNVVIWQSEDEHVWYLADGNTNRPHYTIENEHGRSELSIENEVEHHIGHWRNGPNDTVYLWLPEGCKLEECDIDMGAGYMDSILLRAKQIKANLGAGMVTADGFEGAEISVTVGAGELLADRITAGTADFEIGAGHLSISELSISGEMDLEVSMGAAEVAGTIAGDLEAECSMGEIVMNLAGSEDDHSYYVECGMGNVDVGSYSSGGVASHKSWNAGKSSYFDINCNMGNVTVTFEE
ncbi:MAG: DUF4097 family beta strand repeat-containing protein [Lachnospiraceae bacterium]|nr:DUF4097 family beta strand repeat-containing protein [Lachnospiraceae bacterium]